MLLASVALILLTVMAMGPLSCGNAPEDGLLRQINLTEATKSHFHLLEEILHPILQKLKIGFEVAWRFLQEESAAILHDGLGFPSRLCSALRSAMEAEGEETWWCAVCNIVHQVQNFFR